MAVRAAQLLGDDASDGKRSERRRSADRRDRLYRRLRWREAETRYVRGLARTTSRRVPPPWPRLTLRANDWHADNPRRWFGRPTYCLVTRGRFSPDSESP